MYEYEVFYLFIGTYNKYPINSQYIQLILILSHASYMSKLMEKTTF